MNSTTFMLSDRVYDAGKRLTQVILPAIGALYFSLAKIWNFPAAEEVVGTLACVATFIGVTLGISNKNYEASGYDGSLREIELEPQDEGETASTFRLEVNKDLDELRDKKSIQLKVKPVHRNRPLKAKRR